MTVRTNDIWEHKSDKFRIIVGRILPFTDEMDIAEVFDTNLKVWYNINVIGLESFFNFIGND